MISTTIAGSMAIASETQATKGARIPRQIAVTPINPVPQSEENQSNA
jgi:hypothetical protein